MFFFFWSLQTNIFPHQLTDQPIEILYSSKKKKNPLEEKLFFTNELIKYIQYIMQQNRGEDNAHV